MTREEFLEKYRHRISGLVLDAMFGDRAQGGELSLRMRTVLKQIDALIIEMYREFPQPAPNGQPVVKSKT